MHHSKMRQPGVRPWLHLDQNVRIPKSLAAVHGILPWPIFVSMACANSTMLPRKSQETPSIQENWSVLNHAAQQALNNGSLHSVRFARHFLNAMNAMARRARTTPKTWGLFNESSLECWGWGGHVINTPKMCKLKLSFGYNSVFEYPCNTRRKHEETTSTHVREKNMLTQRSTSSEVAQACVVPSPNLQLVGGFNPFEKY